MKMVDDINYQIFSKKTYHSRFDFLLTHYKKGNILDLGNLGGILGKGKSNSSFLKFQETLDKKSKLYGFDLYKPKSTKFYPRQKQGNIEEKLPYKNNFFDTIYMGEIIEHVKNPGIVFDELNRILKIKGVLILDTPNPYGFERILKYLFKRRELLGDPTHQLFFTPASIKRLLSNSGFTIIEIADKYYSFLNLLPKFVKLGMGDKLLVLAQKKAPI